MNRVLIVDDKAENLYLLRMLLQGHGYQVDEAPEGASALALARRAPPDLVISDLLMPEMDGYTLLHLWKADARLRVIPFIVYTATYTDYKDELLALEMGADAFIVKPSEPPEFLRQMEGVLERARRGEAALPRQQSEQEAVVLKSYNAVLVRKLEQRTAQLEQSMKELHESERSQRVISRALDASANGILIAEVGRPEHHIVYVNPAFERITGYPATEVIGQSPASLLAADFEQEGTAELHAAIRDHRDGRAVLRSHRKDGSAFWIELALSPVRADSGAVTHFVGVLDDITDRKRFEDELAVQANFDALTGLANRNLLEDRVAVTIAFTQHSARVMAMLFIDLDQFKRINDSLGHLFGDALLREVAQRVTACLRDRDTAARLGGDEFVVVLADLARAEDAATVARKILQAIAEPILLEGRSLTVSASIGAAIFPQDGSSYATLLRNADSAMYRAKEAGRACYRFYTADMNVEAVARLELEAGMRRALEHDELCLHFQPVFDCRSGSLRGLEALVRWQTRDGSLVMPDAFIPIAEETRLIGPLGSWVIEETCHQLRRWADLGLEGFTVAVNLSPQQFREPLLAREIDELLQVYRIPAKRLKVEITESSMMPDPSGAAATIAQLNACGVEVAVDDFGTGYSSLAHLQRFALSELKIDRSFVQAAPDQPEAAAIVGMMIQLARSLRLRSVAEGIETEAQRALMQSLACDQMQGYLLGRPQSAAQTEILLRQWLAGA